ncbi:outer membrane protein [Photobacterium leiognathi]|uniref:outer membrane protein n=1 Tax=Photobacterium leiognathi TaxID=553611 RepID=UPI0027389126|nr:outer membrane beta-barrel protein [Photobacterium leiognathi]
MNKTLLATLLLSAIFSSTSFAAEQSTTETETYSPSEPLVLTPVVTEENDASLVEEAPKFDDTMHYFVGVTGGMADLSLDVNTGADKLQSPDASGFFGADIGFYTAGGKGRIYYSYQKMSGESDHYDKKAIDTDVSLHLISADYIFRADETINPFVGAHVGYMNADSKGDGYGSYKQSGPLLGMQAGVAWRMSDHFTAEMGARHSATQSKEQEAWSGSNTKSDLKSITTFYMSANYRF